MARQFVEIVTIGDEILLGETLDANAAFLGSACARAGFEVRRSTTLPDEPAGLRAGLAEARARGGPVLLTGGLGPTPDDLTRWAVAEVFGLDLELRPELLEVLEARFRAFGTTTLPAGNRAQVELPRGSEALPNPRGTAPGFVVDDGRSAFFAMPGVPGEMRAMFEDQVLPRLRSRAAGELAQVRQRLIRTAGLGESALAERIADLLDGRVSPRVAFLPGLGDVDVRLTAPGLPIAEADAALAELEGAIVERLRPWVYGRDADTLAGAVGAALLARESRVALAESCTGGLVGDLLTDVPGSSAWFVGGIVAYADEVKVAALGVSRATLAAHGAVSEETCREMAAGVRTRLGASCALAITGIAGPGGGTAEKPVGLVWITADVDGETRVQRRQFGGTRREVKARAARTALLLLLRALDRVGAHA